METARKYVATIGASRRFIHYVRSVLKLMNIIVNLEIAILRQIFFKINIGIITISRTYMLLSTYTCNKRVLAALRARVLRIPVILASFTCKTGAARPHPPIAASRGLGYSLVTERQSQ